MNEFVRRHGERFDRWSSFLLAMGLGHLILRMTGYLGFIIAGIAVFLAAGFRVYLSALAGPAHR